jgi:hypothetical protein
MELVCYDLKTIPDNFKKKWEDFLIQSANGSWYQSFVFNNYYAYKADSVKALFFLDNGQIKAVFPCGILMKEKVVKAPFSASFGGLIFSNDLKLEYFVEIFSLIKNWCKKEGLERVFIRQTPQIYQQQFDERWESALLAAGAVYSSQESSIFHVIERPGDLLGRFSSSFRRYIKKYVADDIFIFSEAQDASSIEETINAITQIKKQKEYNFSVNAKEICDLKKLFPEGIKVFRLEKDKQLIGGLILYLQNSKVALAFNWDVFREFNESHATQFLLYKTMLWVYENCRDCHYFDFNIFNDPPDWHLNMGLARFKESFDGQGYLRKSYLLEIK